MSIEAMKKALEYLQENEGTIADVSSSAYVKEYYEFMERFAGVIKQAEKQEPVLWLKTWSDGSVDVLKIKSHLFTDHELEPLYTAPPKAAEWVGLTDEEIQDLSYLSQKIDATNSAWFDRWEFARAIEQALKEKNT
jgi:hypothetical protein